MRVNSLKLGIGTAVVAALSVVAVGCSPAADDTETESGKTVVTFRLWDDQVAKAYEQSFAAFEKQHEDIDVQIETIPWDDYWTRLPQDVGSKEMADVFWTNTSNFGLYADNGNLIDVGAELGDQQDAWKESVVDLYTRNGKLWGVPQLWDSIALFYNKDLVDEANVDPTKLRWDPKGGAADTLIPAARELTVDANGKTADQAGFDSSAIERFGFNAALDSQAIYWDFVGSNGGTWQDGDRFEVDSPATVEAIQYVVDLINTEHVAPSAADTNENGEKTLDLFNQGKLALYQSGPYRLKAIEEAAKFDWAIAPMVAGPAGRVSVVHGVAAVGFAQTEHKPETVEVLKWLGTEEGQRPIAEGGYALPGVVAAEPAFVKYWSDKGVDVEQFVDAANGDTFPAPLGPKVQAGSTAMDPILKEIFLGRTPVAKGLTEAEQAGNAAMRD